MDKLAYINSIIIAKRTNVIVSLDTENAAKVLNTANILGPYILGIKLHTDIIENFTSEVIYALLYVKTLHNLIIIDDRKFCDIGNIVKLQSKLITKYADLITVQSISGQGVLDGLRSNCMMNNCRVLLIAQMSSKYNLIDENYTENTLRLANENKDLVTGFICQRKLSDSFLHFTPGVHNNVSSDDLRQTYSNPTDLIYTKETDVLIVGRGIMEQLVDLNISSSMISSIIKPYNHINYNNLIGYCSTQLSAHLNDHKMILQGKEFTLSSGQKSKIYYNLKNIISYPILQKQIALYITCLIQHICQTLFLSDAAVLQNITLAGVPVGGLSLAAFVSSYSNLPSILVRDKQKTHGTCKQIEGDYFNKNIIIIEDVITTGNSVKEFITLIKQAEKVQKSQDETCKDYKVNIVSVISLVNRGNVRFLNTEYGVIPVKSLIFA